jgi:hypothetical protein
MNEPVGVNTAYQLLRVHASAGAVVAVLVRELDITRDEAETAFVLPTTSSTKTELNGDHEIDLFDTTPRRGRGRAAPVQRQ